MKDFPPENPLMNETITSAVLPFDREHGTAPSHDGRPVFYEFRLRGERDENMCQTGRYFRELTDGVWVSLRQSWERSGPRVPSGIH